MSMGTQGVTGLLIELSDGKRDVLDDLLPLIYDELFEHLFVALKQGVFAEQHQKIIRLAEDALSIEAKAAEHLPADRRQAAAKLADRLVKEFGYCAACRGEMLAYFLRYRDEVKRL